MILDSSSFIYNQSQNVLLPPREVVIYGEEDEILSVNLTRSLEMYYVLNRFPVLNVGMGSEFGSIVGSMLLYPERTGGSREIILRPSNLSDYCRAEMIFVNHHVTNVVSNRVPVSGVLASASIVGIDEDLTGINYSIFTLNMDETDSAQFLSWTTRWRNPYFVRIHRCPDERLLQPIDEFPSSNSLQNRTRNRWRDRTCD